MHRRGPPPSHPVTTMKLFTAAAAAIALAIGGAAFPNQAVAGATCSVIDQANFCIDMASGTFEITSIHASNPIHVMGRCGGKVVWQSINYPAVNELYKIICQDGDLDVER
jgi:hypothetical protein